ncbi:GGDEF domain-containing protein [Thermospira aquatica]|uniref:diguanylate cyclase n=1 Tax=Thermospira aquatica TaxID=2828656 RepID=A0AAX3BCS5_9SPIR|nr:GGDEF domain-containing protein [Thermospira aquatica]URA09819.1 GGDEF domain-containing protein [Thermospira aquatica]
MMMTSEFLLWLFGGLVVVLTGVLFCLGIGYFRLRQQIENQKVILTAINASEDIGYILSEILSLMYKVLQIPVAHALVTIAEETQLRILYPTKLEEGKIYHFFSSLSRSEMYQFLLQCISLTKNIFASRVLGSTKEVSLESLALFQRFQDYKNGEYLFLIIPIYDKEIAGLIVLEAESHHLFGYKNAKRLQKIMPLLNVAFSRVLLLWNLRQQSITDPLTGMLNKRQFVLMAEKLFSLSKRKEHPFALAILDIDNFKHINDSYGHHVGDIILKDIAELMMQQSRKSDYLFRIGGDEFCVLFSDIPSIEEIRVYSDRIYEAVKNYDQHKPNIVKEPITVSFGWAIEKNAENWVEVFEKADRHMYEQKRKHHENHWYS